MKSAFNQKLSFSADPSMLLTKFILLKNLNFHFMSLFDKNLYFCLAKNIFAWQRNRHYYVSPLSFSWWRVFLFLAH